MRSRELVEQEIEELFECFTEAPDTMITLQNLTVELLLDLRDLLQGLQPPTIMFRQVEVNIDDKGLRDQNPRTP